MRYAILRRLPVPVVLSLLAIALLAATLLVTATPVVAQVSPDGVWTASGNEKGLAGRFASVAPDRLPSKYGAFDLDTAALRQILDAAPMEGEVPVVDSPSVLTLPLPDGTFERFRVVESPFLGPQVQAEIPDYRSYLGQGIDDPTATVRFDLSGAGFHAMGRTQRGTLWIDPWTQGATGQVISAFRGDYPASSDAFECLQPFEEIEAKRSSLPEIPTSGDVLHEYELVVTATNNFFCKFDTECGESGASTVPGAQAVATTINRVNSIYEDEASIRLILIGILSWYPAEDPFPDDLTIDSLLLDQNQSLTDAAYGASNYDVGHLMNAGGGGGLAQRNGPCSSVRARGATSLIDPVGDPWAVDYVAHEIGHQFGAPHTFAGTEGACAGNSAVGHRVEPGSGSTIMAYAGICGSQNVQSNSHPYFHALSLMSIISFRDAVHCGDEFATGNTPPDADAGPDGFIPTGTPFYLNGAGTDADGDGLWYNWEQVDDNSPLFRSLSPVPSSVRYFPDAAQVLAGASDPWEILPTTGRDMFFRMTARDNRAGGGGVDDDQIRVTVAGDPFVVTSPNGGEHFRACEPVAVTWDAGISASYAPTVRVLLRNTDTQNFEVVAITDNDGSETLLLPTGLVTGNYRLWIEGNSASSIGVRFYDVSDADIQISGGYPNYAPWQPAGWQDSIVPRPVPDATTENVELPGGLIGGGVAFVSWAYLNTSLVYGCSDVLNTAYLDEQVIGSSTYSTPPESGWYFTNYPIGVRAGRHTVWQVSDPLDQILEHTETDNGYARQWVWAPENFVSYSRASGPPIPDAGREFIPAGTVAYDNVDGYRNGTAQGNWIAFAVSSTDAATDYDISIYPQSTGLEDGFEIPLAESGAGVGATDAILVNTRVAGVPTYDVGVRNSNAATSGYELRRHDSGADFLNVGDVAFDVSVGFNQMVWVDEYFVGPDELGDLTVEVLNVSTSQPVTLTFFDRQFGYGSIYHGAAATGVGPDGRASITRNITQSGHYGVALIRNAKDGTQPFTFDWKVRDPSLVLPFAAIDDGLPELKTNSAIDWGDFDGDGDLDLAISGATAASEPMTRVYRNDAGALVDAQVGLEPSTSGSVAWGDADGDGDLDLLVTGWAAGGGRIARIYQNDTGVFTDMNAGLSGAASGSAEWGDYDADGDLDILIYGQHENGFSYTSVYENDGGVFTDASVGLPFAGNEDATWADYDGDGDLDILQTGSGGASWARLWRNDAGNFADSGVNVPDLRAADAAWGDYDSDGDLDFAITGSLDGSYVNFTTRVYRNDGGTTFAPLPETVEELWWAKVAWGDYDNDGDLDLHANGRWAPFDTKAVVYTNDDGVFRDAGPGLLDAESGRNGVAWGDYDVDGDLDLLLIGDPGVSEARTQLYRNDLATPNTPPSTPTDLSFDRDGSMGTFSWGGASDAETPAAGLTYELRVGSSPGACDVFVSLSDPATGYRRVARPGNVGSRRSVSVDLGDSTTVHYWSVQAVDAGFLASPFAAERSTVVEGFVDIGAALEGISGSSVVWGDYDADGDLDLLLAGLTATNARITRVYRNDDGNFVDINAGLTGTYIGATAWGDYDNDGDLDILYTGLNSSNVRIYRIYRNDAGSFVDVSNGLQGVSASSVAWGDYDNDGDLDILLTGRKEDLDPLSEIYRNDAGTFTAIGAGLIDLYQSSGVWSDYDGDGDLDALIAGIDGGGIHYTILYQNVGGAFVDVGAGLPGVLGSHFAWGDYDEDGDPDLLFTGATTSARIARIYRNDAGSFVDIGAGLEGVFNSCVDWGDYDNDGDLDVLLAGRTTTNARIARIYENDGGTFADIDEGFVGVTAASAHFGDYEADGDVDVLIAGLDSGGGRVAVVYRNDRAVGNAPPVAPATLDAQIDGNLVTFSWTEGFDAETPTNALTYSLRVGTTPGGFDVVSATADVTSGRLRIPEQGNAGQRLEWTLDVTAHSGQPLYWSVQTVDASYTGSMFADEEVLDLGATAAPSLPSMTLLRQNHPNPFNPATTIEFDLRKTGPVDLSIYDIAGRQIRTMVRGSRNAGRHSVVWRGFDDQGRRVASGAYLYRLVTGDHVETRRMILLK